MGVSDATTMGSAAENPFRSGYSYISDLVSTTKPRIMVLLLISTCCPMVLASGGKISFALVCWVLLGGALVSGSASALNCVWDRDIDSVMERTKERPLAAKRLSVPSAVLFALAIGALGLFLLAEFVNPFAAWVALGGHVFYVVIYTMLLKRSTPQNIVIGGAAGAVPPLVGWAAVTGSLSLTAWLLFAIVFLWTPPHFWALALNRNADYQRAGVPMLPVVAGVTSTVRQMLIYALLLIPVGVLPVFTSPELGPVTFTGMLLLSLVFAWKVFKLSRATAESRERRAWDVFGFSLIYLALFFVLLVVDSTFI